MVVLTFNEEVNLPACLESVAGMRVLIVDSGSTDATLDIARARGAEVFSHPFETHAKQWAWAVSNLPLREAWVLGLDADQSVTPELRREIEDVIPKTPPSVEGYYMPRRQIFRGRFIRWGGYYPKYLLKLFRKAAVRFDEADVVDHHFFVSGRTEILKGDIMEANRKEDDISVWVAKHNRYASLQANADESRVAPSVLVGKLFGTPDQRVLALKGMWNCLPLFVRPILYFLYRYVLRLGFLDGKQGFVFHVLQGFWYRLLIDIKRDEIRAARRRTEGFWV